MQTVGINVVLHKILFKMNFLYLHFAALILFWSSNNSALNFQLFMHCGQLFGYDV